jgi:hypothetical protein
VRVIDLTGQRFGRLRVLGRVGSLRGALWECLCDPEFGGCGNVTHVCSGDLRRKRPVRSCGCNRGGYGRFSATHGHTVGELRLHGGSPEYCCWQSMLQRCKNKKAPSWRLYGGRGIRVHMGPRPSIAYSVDRFPNQNGNYEPGNVRWATAKQQGRNTRSCKLTETDAAFVRHWCARGFRVKDISEAFGVTTSTISAVKSGKTWA